MVDFEKKYDKYIKKLKNEIPYVLGNKRLEIERNFKHDPASGQPYMGISWFLFGIVGSLITGDTVVPRIIFALVWIGAGIFLLIYSEKHKEAVSDYFFSQYEYKKIIEERIEQDKQQEIKAVLNKMFKSDNLSFADLDKYRDELEDIKDFYYKCLREIKYEQFDEKL